jgi:prolyl-tRNA synthetase
MRLKREENFKEEEFNSLLKNFLREGEIVDDYFPAKGISSWYPYGHMIMENILLKAKKLLEKINFREITLSSFINGEEFLKECRAIKDFSERVYWSPVFIGDDYHVVKPTIEAQICSLISENHKEFSVPLKIFTVREVGRYETGKTFPIWKERNVWPFFELFSVHEKKNELVDTIKQETLFMKIFFREIGLPVLIVSRPKIIKRLQEYSEKRIEAVSITPYNRVVVLANIYNLGNIFSKVYSLKGKNNKYLQMSTLGFSGRVLISAVSFLANHEGLLIPPQISPFDVEFVLVHDESVVINYAEEIKRKLKNKKIKFFSQEEIRSTYGERKRKAVKKGSILLIFIGEKEVATNTVLIKNQLSNKEEKISKFGLAEKIEKLLIKIKLDYEKTSKLRLKSTIVEAKTLTKAKNNINNNRLSISSFCENENCLIDAEKSTNSEIIGVPLNSHKRLVSRFCLNCGKKASQNVILGKKWKGEK